MVEKLNIMSFNIKNDSSLNADYSKNDANNRPYLVANYIREKKPLCIGLQEMTDKAKEYMMPFLIDYEIIGKNRYSDKAHAFNEQTAILINKKLADVIEHDTIWLSTTPFCESQLKTSLFPRTCTMAKIQLKSTNKQFRIFNIHLDFLLPYARMKQIEILLNYISHLQAIDPLPFIIMGDFNASNRSKVIKYLSENKHPYSFSLRDIYKELDKHSITNTYHGLITKLTLKKSPIDYIFVSECINIEDTHIIHDEEKVENLSDHYPISTTISL